MKASHEGRDTKTLIFLTLSWLNLELVHHRSRDLVMTGEDVAKQEGRTRSDDGS
ncbi:hypothetical protein TIFTF001_020039 [Ficus carica]|uniref:Uncharacterized protein n=1 Tax=Ficus carica TaxID=3494 RepID=A0AA88ATL0_FICCA|nr:hypothetical protein TIFTF001_020039 [Ficus carica]